MKNSTKRIGKYAISIMVLIEVRRILKIWRKK